MQATLATSVSFSGTGLHSGRPVRMTVHPAGADTGIVFHRTDMTGIDAAIPARWDQVCETVLSTRIGNAAGATIGTIEHLMAAFAGCGIHNARVEINGPEVPILDGSSRRFVREFLQAGVQPTRVPLRAFRIMRSVTVTRDDAFARLDPAEGLSIRFQIEFDDPAIGVQFREADMSNGRFVRDYCDSRTFCLHADIGPMRSDGQALGGTFENAVVFDNGSVKADGGLRHADEPVRHKMLDALGDLALAGRPLLGAYRGHLAGHGLTNMLLREVFSDPASYEEIICTPAIAAKLPGTSLAADDLAAVA